jgi:hypothetical protein
MLLPIRVMQVVLWTCAAAFCSPVFAIESTSCRLGASLHVVTCSEKCSLSQVDGAGKTRELKQADSWRQFERQYHRQPGGSPSDRWVASSAALDIHTAFGVLDTPTAVTPDQSRIAAAIAPSNAFDEYGPKQEFAVLETSSKDLIWRRQVNGTVESLAWSPDGLAIAAVVSAPAEKPKRGLVDAVAKVFGWRVEHRRAWLKVFDAEGITQCEIDLYRDLKTPTTYVVWTGPQ